ncbi:MAG: hypothetical protein Q9203_007111 [Teloschistes exilis]
MVTAEALIDLPHITSQENEAQPQFQALLHDSAGYCLAPTVDGMAEEIFDHRYSDGALQHSDYQSMPMQRFLIQPGPYVATRPMLEQQYPQFLHAKDQSPVTPGLYGAPNPWPQSITTGRDLCPPERWSSDWASPNESCSGTTGAPWSPRATDSCSDYDPRYSNWAPPHPYAGEYGYADYGSAVVQRPTDLSCQSNGTGALSEIQQYPDTEPEDVSLKGATPLNDRSYSGMSSHLPVRSANFHRDEGLGSSVNESAMDSPKREDDDDDDDEDVAMESVNADSGNGSEYAPRSRSTRTARNRNSRKKGAYSPLAKRSSISKADPHQLTGPAKIAKRTLSSSIPRPSFPTTQSTCSNASQTHRNSNGRDHQCPHCLTSFPFPATLAKHVLSTHTRPFICSFSRYGCTSRFGSKNEWKRHVSSQHLCPEIWRCDIGACVPRPNPRSRQNGNNNKPQSQGELAGHNEFNRKDLFMSHLRRMHKPHNTASRAEKTRFDSSLESIGQRCCLQLRGTPPKTICGYCVAHGGSSDPMREGGKKSKDVVFDGAGTWDERMEHVGKHLEKEENPGYEVEDEELRNWMVMEGLLKKDRGLESGWRVVGTSGGRRRKVDVRRDDVGEEDAEGDEDVDADADADGEDDV